MKRKAIILINSSWNIVNFRQGIVSGLVKSGFKVIAVAPEDAFSVRLADLGCQHLHIKLKPRSKNVFYDLKYLVSLLLIFKKERPDIILTYTIKPNLYGSLAGRILGIPVLPNVAGLGATFSKNSSVLNTFVRLLYRLSFSHDQRVFFQNSTDLKEFVNSGFVKEQNSFLLPGSGVNLEKLEYSEMPLLRPIRFLLASRMLKSKGIEDFAKAARKLIMAGKKLECWIYGSLLDGGADSIDRNELNSWNEENFIAYKGVSNDIPAIMRNVHCVVLPTYYKEGTPKVLLEAAAIGRVIITTDTPGCRDVLLDGQSGYLCQPQNPSDLASKMLKVIESDNATLTDFGKCSRLLAEQKFDEKYIVSIYLKVIQQELTDR